MNPVDNLLNKLNDLTYASEQRPPALADEFIQLCSQPGLAKDSDTNEKIKKIFYALTDDYFFEIPAPKLIQCFTVYPLTLTENDKANLSSRVNEAVVHFSGKKVDTKELTSTINALESKGFFSSLEHINLRCLERKGENEFSVVAEEKIHPLYLCQLSTFRSIVNSNYNLKNLDFIMPKEFFPYIVRYCKTGHFFEANDPKKTDIEFLGKFWSLLEKTNLKDAVEYIIFPLLIKIPVFKSIYVQPYYQKLKESLCKWIEKTEPEGFKIFNTPRGLSVQLHGPVDENFSFPFMDAIVFENLDALRNFLDKQKNKVFPSVNRCSLSRFVNPMSSQEISALRAHFPNLTSMGVNLESLRPEDLPKLVNGSSLDTLILAQGAIGRSKPLDLDKLPLEHLNPINIISSSTSWNEDDKCQFVKKGNAVIYINAFYDNILDFTKHADTKKVSDIFVESLGRIGHLLGKKKINLSGCSTITDKSMNFLSRGEDLTHISLDGCNQISDNGIIALISRCRKLQEIQLPNSKVLNRSNIDKIREAIRQKDYETHHRYPGPFWEHEKLTLEEFLK